MQFQKHFVVIISPVHDEGSLAKKGGATLHSGKVYVIDEVKIFSSEKQILEKMLAGWSATNLWIEKS